MIVCMGGKAKTERSLGGLVDRRAQRAKRVPSDGRLVLDARAGVFKPNRNNDRSHRITALLGHRGSGAAQAKVMLGGRGH